jgi:DNA-directed RNA polymerase subunit RPC12/RpoP
MFAQQLTLLTRTIAMISFSCPNCKTKHQREDTEAGTKIVCPSCNRKLLIPTPARLSDKTLAGELNLESDAPQLRRELVPMLPPRAAPPVIIPAPVPTGPPIRCSCPHCQGSLWFDVQQAGSRLPCSHCGLPVEIPWPKAVLHEEMPVPSVLSRAPASQPAPVIIVQQEAVGRRPQEERRAEGGSAVSWLLLAVGFGMLALLTFCISFGVVFVVGNQSRSNEAEVATLRNQITSVVTQLRALEVECGGAIERRDQKRIITLTEQAAERYAELAVLQDGLAAKLSGADRDECVRTAAHNRAQAQHFRLQAAEWRANP